MPLSIASSQLRTDRHIHDVPSSKIPAHIGPLILPDFPTFHRLLFLAHRKRNIAINDITGGFKATHSRLLSDILYARNALELKLSLEVQHKLLRGEEVTINLLAKGGYEFAVAFFAIVALGAIVVPLSVSVPLQEAAYFVRTSSAAAVVVTPERAQFGKELCRQIQLDTNPHFTLFEIGSALGQPQIQMNQIRISSDHSLNLHGSGVIIFTSGTTGPPKGAVKKRTFLVNNVQNFSDWWEVTQSDTMLHVLPVHHATGLGINFLMPLLVGASIEFDMNGFSAARMWERWRKGGLTIFSGVPTMYQRLMLYFQDNIMKRPKEEVQEYVRAARAFRIMLCGTSALPMNLQAKWRDILGGKRILERYGGTEFSGIFSVQPGDNNNPDGSVGKIFPGAEVKLSAGTEGEVLMKTPHMFIKYINDPEATAAAFTPDGWYKSGDIARREGDYFFILGRASIDILKSGGYKISALDIERELLSLDYVSEAVVVGVNDEEYGQKVAAAIIQRHGILKEPLTISQLRSDLRERLASYKLPLLLRIVNDFPRTASGKVQKKRVRTELFENQSHPDVQIWKFTTAAKL